MKEFLMIPILLGLSMAWAQAEIKDVVYEGGEICVHTKKDHVTMVVFPEPITGVTRGFAADSYVVQRKSKESNILEFMPTSHEMAEMSVSGVSAESYVLKFEADEDFYTKLIIHKKLDQGKNDVKHKRTGVPSLPDISLHEDGGSGLAPAMSAKVTLKGNDLPLRVYLSTLSRITGFNFMTTPEIDAQKTSANLENIEVWRALKSLLFRYGYGFKLSSHDVIITALETRIFTLKALPLEHSFIDSTSNQSFENTANANNGSSTSQQQSQDVTVGSKIYYENAASKLSIWEDLESNVKSILTPKTGTYSINRTTGMIIVTDQPSVLDKIGDVVSSMNEALSRQQTFEIQIYEVNLSNSRETGIDWSLLVNNMKGLARVASTSSLSSAGFLDPQMLTLSAAVPNGESGLAKGGVSMVLKALEQQGDIRVISKPSITVTNRFPAVIQAVSSIPYIAGTGSTIGTNVSQTNVTTSQVSDGLTLRLEAQISDHKTILNISVVQNSLDAMNSVPLAGGLTIQEPQVSTRSVTTNVEIEDHKTLVLGGLISETRKRLVEGVPYLSKIPVMGNAFQFKDRTHERSELVIFITPVPAKPAE